MYNIYLTGLLNLSVVGHDKLKEINLFKHHMKKLIITCNQALFLFPSVKHLIRAGKVKIASDPSKRKYEGDAKIRPDYSFGHLLPASYSMLFCFKNR